MQRVVRRRLPVRTVRRARERAPLAILHEAGVAPRAIATAVPQVLIARQIVPGGREHREVRDRRADQRRQRSRLEPRIPARRQRGHGRGTGCRRCCPWMADTAAMLR